MSTPYIHLKIWDHREHDGRPNGEFPIAGTPAGSPGMRFRIACDVSMTEPRRATEQPQAATCPACLAVWKAFKASIQKLQEAKGPANVAGAVKELEKMAGEAAKKPAAPAAKPPA